MRKLSVPLRSETVARLGLLYLKMMTEPVFVNLNRFSGLLVEADVAGINAALATITAFETLLTYTLFSGRTNSYVRELVWAEAAL